LYLCGKIKNGQIDKFDQFIEKQSLCLLPNFIYWKGYSLKFEGNFKMPKIKKIEDVINELNEIHNYTIELTKYCGMGDKKSSFRCIVCGNEWDACASNILYGAKSGCPRCSKSGRPISVDINETKRRLFKKHRNNIELLEFNGYCNRCKFKCNICNYEWYADARKVTKGSGCPECARNNDKLSSEYVENFISSKGCIWISGNYENAKGKLLIEFKCGHSRNVTWNEFQQGKRCNICGIKDRCNQHKTKKEEIVKFLNDHDLEFISFVGEYTVQKKTDVIYKCKLGHLTTRKVDHVFQYPTCNKCEMIELVESNRNINKLLNSNTRLASFIRCQLWEWKQESMKNCNYKCVITNKSFKDIHHLYSYNLIIIEALAELEFVYSRKVSNYSEEQLYALIDKIKEIHKKYPLGVCLTREIHDLFHHLYGIKNTTPEMWYDFVSKINNKEILIN
jgi:hypothetical protein